MRLALSVTAIVLGTITAGAGLFLQAAIFTCENGCSGGFLVTIAKPLTIVRFVALVGGIIWFFVELVLREDRD
jgi:hypothetical protein